MLRFNFERRHWLMLVTAYATTNEEGDLAMLFFDDQEARKYSGDDEPIKLIVSMADYHQAQEAISRVKGEQ